MGGHGGTGSEMQQTGLISVEMQDLSEGFQNTFGSAIMHFVSESLFAHHVSGNLK
jgi:hypothetical protein